MACIVRQLSSTHPMGAAAMYDAALSACAVSSAAMAMSKHPLTAGRTCQFNATAGQGRYEELMCDSQPAQMRSSQLRSCALTSAWVRFIEEGGSAPLPL